MIATLRSGIRIVFAVIWTGGLLIGVSLHQSLSQKSQRSAVYRRYTRIWSLGLLWLAGVRLSTSGCPPSGKGPQIVISNHRSPLDVPILLSKFGGIALSRADVQQWPLIGIAARRAGTIFVDRNDRGSGAKAISAMSHQLLQGATVIIFPEGTTFAGDLVRPFRAGVFVAAKRAEEKGVRVQFVPVGLAYPEGSEFTDRSFGQHVFSFLRQRRSSIGLSIGEPTDDLDVQIEARADAMRQHVQNQVSRARAQLNT